MMETLTHGYDGMESFFENHLANRGVTLAEHIVKMDNLTILAKQGFRVMKAVHHDKYEVKGKDGFYNPYEDFWYG